MARNSREGTEATRQALIKAARRLFVENGYAETATPEIVAAAGVTRGALYHHFEDKKALFQAVADDEAVAVAAAIDHASAPDTSPQAALLAGARAYFDAMADPGRARLLLIEAPAVLGPDGARAIDRDHAESRLREGVMVLLGPEHPAETIDAVTVLLSAAFDRAVLEIENGSRRTAVEQAIALLIAGLVSPPSQ